MRTLALGKSTDSHVLPLTLGKLVRRKAARGAAARSKGFTLIEVMVAMLVGSVMFGLAVLSLKSLDRSLQVEAQRLSQLLGFARDYAQMRGRPVRFEADEQGYRFVVRNGGQWALVLDEPVLRERTWEKPTRITLEKEALALGAVPVAPVGVSVPSNAEAPVAPPINAIEFGRDFVDTPFRLWLAQDTQKLAVASNGLGRFQVEQEATQ